jgi:hypothetical protein
VEKTLDYVKLLRLTPAQGCQKLGITAENPAFLSPALTKEERCPLCNAAYRPLVYQTGQLTLAHHWHKDCGGIYVFVRSKQWLRDLPMGHPGWIAGVELMGQQWLSPRRGAGTRFGTAEAVYCWQISAQCMAGNGNTHVLLKHVATTKPPFPHPHHDVQQALLLPVPPDMSYPGALVPICERIEIPPQHAPLAFVIRDGTVYFRQR